MFKLLLSSILIATSVLAQDSVMLRDFSGGLNTVSSDFDIAPKYGRVVHNFDLGRNVGALTRRLGYDSVSAISSSVSDSIRYPYGVYLSDGRQFLAYFSDITNRKYGEIQRSDINGKDISLSYTIAQYWGMKYPTTYAMQNGILFMANGQNRMLAYDAIGGKFAVQYPNPFDGGASATDYARPIPPYAPGEIEVYPLLDTTGSGVLYGDYMWAIVLADSVSDTATNQTNGRKLLSYITPRMRIDSGRALIGGFFNYFVSDSLTSTCPVRYVKLYRTKSNPGPLTKFTTFYATKDSVKFPGGASTVVDSKADASLSTTDSIVVTDRELCERGYGVKAGQPQIKLTQIIVDSLTGLARNTKGLGILKWAWACTYVDTSYDAESDTGRRVEMDSVNLSILTGGDSTGAKRVDLYLPKPKSTYKNMGINIYRAPVMSIADSTPYWTAVQDSGVFLPHLEKKWRKFFNKDTSITGPFRMVGSAKISDSVFVDTFGMEKWSAGQILRQNRPPSAINNLVSYGGRLFGSSGSRLFMTQLDSGSFAQMRFIDINQDDGDEITAIFPTRRSIRAMKGGSSYNVYQDDNGQWSRTEVSNGIGCIAPRSIAHSANGWYYLSGKGVILENDGPYIERTQATQLISAPLKNFDSLTMAAKRLAVGICADNKYLLCIGDTTYVWDERAQAWSTWSLKFNGATLYGVDANINFVRPDTLYFVQPNSRTLYRYGSSIYDNGSNFNMEWRSAPLILDNGDKAVNALGIWRKSADTSEILDLRILNESGTQVASLSDTNLIARYVRLSMPTNLGRGFQIRLLNTDYTETGGLSRTVIDGIDLYYQRQGKVGE